MKTAKEYVKQYRDYCGDANMHLTDNQQEVMVNAFISEAISSCYGCENRTKDILYVLSMFMSPIEYKAMKDVAVDIGIDSFELYAKRKGDKIHDKQSTVQQSNDKSNEAV